MERFMSFFVGFWSLRYFKYKFVPLWVRPLSSISLSEMKWPRLGIFSLSLNTISNWERGSRGEKSTAQYYRLKNFMIKFSKSHRTVMVMVENSSYCTQILYKVTKKITLKKVNPNISAHLKLSREFPLYNVTLTFADSAYFWIWPS